MTQATNTNVNNNPERAMDESYEQYVTRRASMNKATKRLKYGKEFHDAGYAGQYENPEKRKLQEERKARRANKRAV